MNSKKQNEQKQDSEAQADKLCGDCETKEHCSKYGCRKPKDEVINEYRMGVYHDIFTEMS